MLRQLSFALSALIISHTAVAQSTPLKVTPPGRDLMQACKEINSNSAGDRAIQDRIYCFRFIEASLMMEGFQLKQQDEDFKKFMQDKGPLSTRRMHFCYDFSGGLGVTAMDVADVAKKLVVYLQSQPEEALDRRSAFDDVQMRLLMDFLAKEYPCKGR
jgi:hypothetical protein